MFTLSYEFDHNQPKFNYLASKKFKRTFLRGQSIINFHSARNSARYNLGFFK